jgi:hypothetical protein
VQINDPAPSNRTYRFDDAGNFLELSETLNGALRTVRPYR